ncbi:alpha-ketoglutarate-dependent dioxygenase AlkB [Vibrio sp.]|nr:alpha-ketoglutarate-dependent dioxygenase AlkB [Vibrio sp.]
MLLPFDFDDSPIELLDKDGNITCWESFLTELECRQLWEELYQSSPWKHESITLFDKTYQQPRLTCWYGQYGVIADQGYQKLTQARPLTPLLLKVKSKVETTTGYRYNSVLANLYRDENDGVGYHADDETILGHNPAIASLSLGETRRFLVKHNQGQYEGIRIDLKNNLLLLMSGSLQHHWKHAIPKSRKPLGPRINLTFRFIQP